MQAICQLVQGNGRCPCHLQKEPRDCGGQLIRTNVPTQPSRTLPPLPILESTWFHVALALAVFFSDEFFALGKHGATAVSSIKRTKAPRNFRGERGAKWGHSVPTQRSNNPALNWYLLHACVGDYNPPGTMANWNPEFSCSSTTLVAQSDHLGLGFCAV